jgi:acyl-CoA dehydrogenase
MYTMGVVLRHGSPAQKQAYLPKVASGELRLQAFGVTEPDAGTDTTRITTFARREGDHYVVSGKKLWISRAEHSDLMVLLCRTTARADAAKPSDGMSVLLVDMRAAVGNGLTIRPVRTMLNHATTELFFEDLRVPVANLIGEEGKGFKYILDGMNAERILIAAECVGDAKFFIDRASAYAKDRNVFGRAIGENQGVQFPIARAYVQMTAANLMVEHAAALFEAGKPCGTEANMAKLTASEASWYAADMALQTHGGFGFAEEYDIERKFHEPDPQPRGDPRAGPAQVVLTDRRRSAAGVRPALDFERRAARQVAHAQGGASRQAARFEIADIDLVERRELAHVGEEDRAFDHLAHARSVPAEHGGDIVHHLMRLSLEGRRCAGLHPDLARDDEQVTHLDGLRVGALRIGGGIVFARRGGGGSS